MTPVAETRYGHIRGGQASFSIPIGAAETFYSKSGRFVANDASGRAELADENDTVFQGFVIEGAPDDGAGGGGLTTNATEGSKEMTCIIDLTAIFRLPLAYDASTYSRNYSSALLGEHCDIVLINGVQYVNVSASSKDMVRIVGGKASTVTGGTSFLAGISAAVTGLTLGDGYVDVMMLEAKLYSQGVE